MHRLAKQVVLKVAIFLMLRPSHVTSFKGCEFRTGTILARPILGQWLANADAETRVSLFH